MKTKLELAKSLALKASEIVMDYSNTLDFKYKGTGKNNIVTKADEETEKFLVANIKKEFPNHSFLCEEVSGNDSVNSSNIWIIDPIDGTNNYAKKIPHFCISIAYAENNDVKLGVVYDPCRKELFHSIKGEGAYLNGNRISVSQTPSLNESIIATGFYYDRDALMEKTLESIHSLFKTGICGLRRMGSAALDLCWVACGRYDGYFEYKLHPWDFGAGFLFVREAGGVCLDKTGNQMTLSGEGIISSNGLISEEFLEVVRYKYIRT